MNYPLPVFTRVSCLLFTACGGKGRDHLRHQREESTVGQSSSLLMLLLTLLPTRLPFDGIQEQILRMKRGMDCQASDQESLFASLPFPEAVASTALNTRSLSSLFSLNNLSWNCVYSSWVFIWIWRDFFFFLLFIHTLFQPL